MYLPIGSNDVAKYYPKTKFPNIAPRSNPNVKPDIPANPVPDFLSPNHRTTLSSLENRLPMSKPTTIYQTGADDSENNNFQSSPSDKSTPFYQHRETRPCGSSQNSVCLSDKVLSYLPAVLLICPDKSRYFKGLFNQHERNYFIQCPGIRTYPMIFHHDTEAIPGAGFARSCRAGG